jgi:hypothetical protein
MPEGSANPTAVYSGFLDALNRKNLDAAAAYVDVDRYRENCVAFTGGFVNWADAKASLAQVWKGLPDLNVVERVQQSDVLGQMKQLYGRAFGAIGLSAMLWRL